MLRRLCVLLLLVLLTLPAHVRAQSGVAAVAYGAGWNMVGGPDGTDVSRALSLFEYGSSGYVPAAGTTTAGCRGYWADFAAPTMVQLAAVGATSPRSCPLQTGWTLVGNPFDLSALLPAGTVAYYWPVDNGSYRLVDRIPPGGAVWIYSAAAGSVTLTPVPTSGLTLTTSSLHGGPYMVRVGDMVTLLLPSGVTFKPAVPQNLLQLEVSGSNSDGSQFWSWKAIATGKAIMTLNPACLDLQPACALPSIAIEVDILPAA